MRAMKKLETPQEIILEPTVPARASVIWLHGLGADGHDFVPIVPELGLPDDAGIRFVFPHAPVRPVTLNGGVPMRAWYDILGLTQADRQDSSGIRESEQRVRGYIQRELDVGIPAQKIVLAGFSQGGAVALHTGLRYEQSLAGIMALSTYLPLQDSLAAEAAPANRNAAVLACHGTHDPVLPLAWGEQARDVLQALGCSVSWHSYPMQHQVCMEEIEDIAAWLRKRLLAD